MTDEPYHGPDAVLGTKGITDAMLRAALESSAGVYALAAKKLGCSRSNVRQRVEADPSLQEFCEEIDQTLLDAAESVVKNAIIQNDRQTAKWYLERRGKHRGFTTRVETTGPNGGPVPMAPVQVNIRLIPPRADLDGDAEAV